MRLRLLLGAIGVAAAVFGLLRLLQRGLPDVVDATVWLAGGVVVHDALVAPITLGATALAVRIVPDRARVPTMVGLVVLATVTVSAVPVLGGWGRRPDNATLLDRNYAAGWVAMTVVVLVGVAAGLAWRRLVPRTRGGEE
jgi:hypothetical protein